MCRVSREGNYQCSMHDLALDFSKVDKLQTFADHPGLNKDAKWGTVERRTFQDGFARLPCRPRTRSGKIADETPRIDRVSSTLRTRFDDFLPGFEMIQTLDTLQDEAAMRQRALSRKLYWIRTKEKEREEPRLRCQLSVVDPVLVVSHDSTTNFGHLVQDLMNWWLAAEVAGVDRSKVKILSIDGLRPATIHNGKGRVLMNVTHPDDLGPFGELIDRVLFKSSINPLDEVGPVNRVFQRYSLSAFPRSPSRGY